MMHPGYDVGDPLVPLLQLVVSILGILVIGAVIYVWRMRKIEVS